MAELNSWSWCFALFTAALAYLGRFHWFCLINHLKTQVKSNTSGFWIRYIKYIHFTGNKIESRLIQWNYIKLIAMHFFLYQHVFFNVTSIIQLLAHFWYIIISLEFIPFYGNVLAITFIWHRKICLKTNLHRDSFVVARYCISWQVWPFAAFVLSIGIIFFLWFNRFTWYSINVFWYCHLRYLVT